MRSGSAAGTPNGNGYVRISVLGERHHAHRLAWFYVHGVWPPEDVDHIDGCRSNNALRNLRLASRAENNLNLRGPKSGNRSGLLGVSETKSGTYFARLSGRYLGSFGTSAAAAEAYRQAKEALSRQSGGKR